MSQSLANLIVHLVFSTLDREPMLTGIERLQTLHAYLGEVSARLECPTLVIGGMPDHVHVLARLSRTIALADWVKEMKRASTIWIRQQWPDDLAHFHWQAGYGAFSVSQSNTDAVVQYIREQEEHHRVRSFQDELRLLLRRNRVAWDERYVWD